MVKKVSRKSEDLDKQLGDLENKLKRALADYANLERRIEQEKRGFIRFANAELFDKLLPVLDGLERAEKHLKDKGLTLAVGQFLSVLKMEGVREIKALGQKFDAEKMDCMEVIEGPRNVVVEVVNKGYELNGRVLRPAKVKVGRGKLEKRKEF